jgi:uncharacterized membrane protein YhaH (DUF805 family)
MSASITRLNGLVSLLTSFRGRISRSQWWLGYAIVIIGNLCGALLFNPDYFTADEPPPAYWPDTLWQLAWLVPATAITIKRLNDRDQPSWLGYAFAALNGLYYVAPQLGWAIGPTAASAAARIAFWVIALIMLIIFVDNGFFRGTDGPNPYGPDPLDRNAAPT